MLHGPCYCRHSLICQFRPSVQQLLTDDVVTYDGYMDIWCSCSNAFQFHMLLYIVLWPCAFGSGMILVTCVDGWYRQTSFVCYDTMCSGLLVKLTLACCSLGTWLVDSVSLHFHLTSLLPFSTTLFDLVPHFDIHVVKCQFSRSHMLGELSIALGVQWVKYSWLTGTHFRWLQELCLSWWLRVGPPCPLMYVKGWVILYVFKVKVILIYLKAKSMYLMYIFSR